MKTKLITTTALSLFLTKGNHILKVLKRKITLLVLILSAQFAAAQETGSVEPVSSEEFQIQLMKGNSQVSDVEFFKINYRTSTIDLRELRSMGNADIPESIVIIPPKLSSFDHVTTIIGIIRSQDKPKVIVVLAGNYDSNSTTFFLDSDQDRDFTNDINRFRVNSADQPREVDLSINGQAFKMTLQSVKPDKKANHSKIENQLSLALFIGVGSGTLDYSYDDLTIGYPGTYGVKTSEKNLGVSLGYDFATFAFGASIVAQNNFFYTSLLTVQNGPPFYRNVANRSLLVEDIDQLFNEDSHPKNKLQWSLYALYKIKLSKSIDIQPILRAGQISYFNAEYIRIEDDPNEVYEMPNSFFYGYGVRAEFVIGPSKAFYVDYSIDRLNWEPRDFLRNNEHANFTQSYQVGKVNLGYRFALN